MLQRQDASLGSHDMIRQYSDDQTPGDVYKTPPSVRRSPNGLLCRRSVHGKSLSVDIGSGSRAAGNGDRGIDGSSLMRPMSARASSQHSRRESFLYKCDTARDELSPSSRSSRSSINDIIVDDMIVTPYAQLLNSLRTIRNNYIVVANIPAGRSRRASGHQAEQTLKNTQLTEEARQRMAVETLEEVEWCLDKLESMQTHRSAANLAAHKFKRLLTRELSQHADHSQSGNQVTSYIRSFIESDQEIDASEYKADGEELNNSANDVLRDDPTTDGRPRNVEGPIAETDSPAFSAVCDGGEAGPGDNLRKESSSAISFPTGSQTRIPEFGIDTDKNQQLKEKLQNIHKWGMDVFTISELTNHKPLTALTFTILKDRGFLKTFRFPNQTLLNYLSRLEDLYRKDAPYHNCLHAADVTQSSNYLLSLPAFRNVFSDIEILATLLASAAHDVDHPGLTNQFLINTNSELALLYNDESVLENHHVAVAFGLLQEKDCNIFQNFTKKQRQTIRRMVIGMVLATDMSKHIEHVAHLKTMVEVRRLTGNDRLDLENNDDKLRVLQSLVHCADLSNPTKPLDIYLRWTDRIMEEFYRQGDKERRLGLDVSPMCDRHNSNVPKTQVGFIDYIVNPLWETWAEITYPDCQDILDTLESNRQWHQNCQDMSDIGETTEDSNALYIDC